MRMVSMVATPVLHSESVALKRRGVHHTGGPSPRVHDVFGPEASGDGQATSQALAETDDIGHDPNTRAGKHGAGPSEPGPDLVGDQQSPSFVCQTLELRQEAFRRFDTTAASENRLDQHSGDITSSKMATHRLQGDVEDFFSRCG